MLLARQPPHADPLPGLLRPEIEDDDGAPARFRLAPDTRADAADRRRTERDLATATRDKLFVLHYQPRLAIDTGVAMGAEAMIRWPHRKRGMVSPNVFMPLAERSGKLVEICGWALETASNDATGWPPARTVSVGIATRRITAPALLAQIAAALEGSGLDPERLEIGLGETVLLDVDADIYLALSAMRDLGVGVALDDFGTGIASLSMLKRLPLTALKLDRSMIRELPHDDQDAAIVRATIETGRALGLTVVAEGIETEAQRAFLTNAGCALGQGALFGYPLTAEQTTARLA